MPPTAPFFVRGKPGRLVPHPSGHAERWLGYRAALPGEAACHTIAANPDGGAKYVDHKANLRKAPPNGKQPPSIRYPGSDICLVACWEQVPNTQAARAIIPRAIQQGDLEGYAVYAAEMAEAALAAQLAAGVAAMEAAAAAAATPTQVPAAPQPAGPLAQGQEA